MKLPEDKIKVLISKFYLISNSRNHITQKHLNILKLKINTRNLTFK